VLKDIQNILYSTEEGFISPRKKGLPADSAQTIEQKKAGGNGETATAQMVNEGEVDVDVGGKILPSLPISSD
jgi:hypothetical protein